MHFLHDDSPFPDVSEARKDGLLAIGGSLSSDRLIEAYNAGIFPWFSYEEPVLWWSPDPRFVLFPDKIKISKSMKALLKKDLFHITVNRAFRYVIEQCALTKRKNQPGTWISPDMIRAYSELHDRGMAKSVEVWEGKELVGGFYGVDLGNGVFCGESMFSLKSNASKYGFIRFINQSDYKLIDCQVYTDHLKSLGAELLPRHKFLRYLQS